MAIDIDHEKTDPLASDHGASVYIGDHPLDLAVLSKPMLVQIGCSQSLGPEPSPRLGLGVLVVRFFGDRGETGLSAVRVPVPRIDADPNQMIWIWLAVLGAADQSPLQFAACFSAVTLVAVL